MEDGLLWNKEIPRLLLAVKANEAPQAQLQ